MIPAEKLCNGCKRTLPASAFTRVRPHGSATEYLYYVCRECKVKRNRDEYARVGRPDRRLRPEQESERARRRAATRVERQAQLTHAEKQRLDRNLRALRERLAAKVRRIRVEDLAP